MQPGSNSGHGGALGGLPVQAGLHEVGQQWRAGGRRWHVHCLMQLAVDDLLL